MRWLMGEPTSMFTPGISDSLWRMSARSSSFERSLSSYGASISEVFTPRACSSSSARPVFLPTTFISGTESNSSSALRPILSDSSREMPGKVLTFMVKEPSLNGGRKLLPRLANTAMAATRATHVEATTAILLSMTLSKAVVYHAFSLRATIGSCPCPLTFPFPRR